MERSALKTVKKRYAARSDGEWLLEPLRILSPKNLILTKDNPRWRQKYNSETLED